MVYDVAPFFFASPISERLSEFRRLGSDTRFAAFALTAHWQVLSLSSYVEKNIDGEYW